MTMYQVRLTTTLWHYKMIEASSPDEATALAFGDSAINLSDWEEDGLGESEFYETIKTKEPK